MSTIDRTTMWVWREDVAAETAQIEGFGVEAVDGSIGKGDEATSDTGASYIVVDTGPWIFGKKTMLPAQAIQRIDWDDEKVYVPLNKEQVKNAPEFDESTYRDSSYRDQLGSYYTS